MNAKTALGACQALGIGIVSAATLFFVHRALISDGSLPGASTFGSGDAADLSMEPAESHAADRDERVATVRGTSEAAPDQGNARGAAAGGRTEGSADGGVAADRAERGPDGEPTNPHIEALSHPSPAYRNVSLATLIRNAGHACTDVVSSTGHNDLNSWRVSCEGGRAYLVWLGGDEAHVEPMTYFDGQTPFIPVEPTEAPPRLLPPLE